MKRKVVLLMMAVFMSLSVFAETPAETHRKHPDALCMFFKTPAAVGDLKNFDIERIAVYPGKVHLKIAGREKEVVKKISDTTETEDGSIVLFFKDGSSMLLSIEDGCAMYFSTKEQAAIFKFDIPRQEEYIEIKGLTLE